MTISNYVVRQDFFTISSTKDLVQEKALSISTKKYHPIHQIPGRWRIRVERLIDDEEYANNLTSLLQDSNLLTGVRCNRLVGSLIVDFDPLIVNEKQLDDFLVVNIEEASRDNFSISNKTNEDPDEINYFNRLGFPIGSLIVSLLAIPLELPALLVSPIILAACVPAFKRAWQALTQEQTVGVDFLDSVAIILSLWQGHFIPPTLMITLIESGEIIRDSTARSSQRQSYNLLDSLGQYVWLDKEGVQVQIPLKDIKEGDIVAIYPGDLIPVDGKIVEGTALIDQNKLTGESVPVHREIEDEVFASTVVVEGQLLIQVQRLGINTRAGMVVELMKEAPIHDTRIENYAAKFANFAVIPTLLLAGGLYGITGDLSRASSLATLDFGTGIRVSVPTTVLAGLTRAAKTGVFIRSGRAIEMLSKVDCVVFDKTGTLTQGKAAIIGIETISSRISKNEILKLAASAEQGLTHPVAHAIANGAKERGLNAYQCQDWDYKVGLGVVATIKNKTVLVGSSRLMESEGIDISASYIYKTGGTSLAYVARDGKLIGLILYADPIRTESHEVIAALHSQGIETHMLTGDVERVAQSVARELGIDRVHAQAFPEKKVEVVRKLKESGKTVAFIGDGINDSAALAYADVSLSFAAGSDIARETADIVLMDDDLSGLPNAIEIAKSVMEIINQNALIVGIPNFFALAYGIFFRLDPIMAIFINNGSAILAGLNGLRLALVNNKN